MKKVYSGLIAALVVMFAMVSSAYAYTQYTPVVADNLFYHSNYTSYDGTSNLTSVIFGSGGNTNSYDVHDLDDATSNQYASYNWSFSLPLSDISVLKVYASGSPVLKFYDASGVEIYSKTFSASDTTYYDVNISQARYATLSNA